MFSKMQAWYEVFATDERGQPIRNPWDGKYPYRCGHRHKDAFDADGCDFLLEMAHIDKTQRYASLMHVTEIVATTGAVTREIPRHGG